MALTWDQFNSGVSSASISTSSGPSAWDDFNSQMAGRAQTQASAAQISQQRAAIAEARKPKILGPKKTVTGLFGQMINNIRGITEVVLSAPMVAGSLFPGGITPKEARVVPL